MRPSPILDRDAWWAIGSALSLSAIVYGSTILVATSCAAVDQPIKRPCESSECCCGEDEICGHDPYEDPMGSIPKGMCAYYPRRYPLDQGR